MQHIHTTQVLATLRLLAYSEPSSAPSVVAQLLDVARRRTLAAQVNAALVGAFLEASLCYMHEIYINGFFKFVNSA